MESVVGLDLFVKGAENGIVLQKMRQGLGVGKIVNGDEFDVVAMQTRADHISADAAEAVDSYFDCHCFS